MKIILLSIVGMMITILLTILFYSKKHINNKETKIYSRMLIFELLFLILEILTYIVAITTNDLWLISIFQKIYMSLLTILLYYAIKYCLIIFNLKKLRTKVVNTILNCVTLLSIILILILPLKVIFTGSVLDGYGQSYNVAVVYSLFGFLVFIALTIYLLYTHNSIEKVIPFLILIFLLLFGFIIRNFYGELIFEGFFYSFILLIMYHTIENPDVKMLNEVTLAKNHVEKANKVKSEFISSMSHEIRTPLNAIVGYGQMIDFAENLDEAKENAKEIVNASNTLLNMLSNVLDISMVEVNELELKEVEYNLNEIINDVTNLFKYKIETKKLKFKINMKTLKTNLIGDPDKIKRILANLIDNAIKYTEKGKVTLSIEHKINSDKCDLTIVVEDTGKGINKETKKHLFDNFNRAKEHKDSNISGMGLGLSITKSLVEMMNGKITYESEVGKGTNFIVKLNQKVGSKK